MKAVAVILIGRNEGARFERALRAALAVSSQIVYVDSGSTDGSVAFARAKGAQVVELDMTLPFTAARARNAGLAALTGAPPELVQLVDGDCELVSGWIESAVSFLATHPAVGVVCGRRRERFPQRSIYNRLCDAEWNTPVGPTKACGGDALMRWAALQQVGGYRDDLIAGEEPELCVRLRAAGWGVYRLDLDMTWHDAAMSRFAQWWRRAQRAGHAFAEGHALHGAPPERHYQAEVRRPWLWALALPGAACALALTLGPGAGAALLLAYPLQVLRLAARQPSGMPLRWAGPFFLLLGKFPELLGQLVYWRGRCLGRKAAIMEYK